MANKYVDARNGNDANDGSTWALAKKTLGAMSLAAADGDTINCAGVFNEQLTLNMQTNNKTLTFQAVGSAILDGGGTLATAVTISGTAPGYKIVTFNGFIVRNYTSIGFYCATVGGSYIQLTLNDCFIDTCVNGIYNTAYMNPIVRRTVIRNCSAYGIYDASGTAGKGNDIIENCTFTGNGTGVTIGGHATNTIRIFGCIFKDSVSYNINISQAGQLEGVSNSNCYRTVKNRIVGVDYTSLSTWKAAVTPRDSNSIDSDPLFIDSAKGVFMLQKTSPAVINGMIIGAYNNRLGEGCSDNFNSAIWDAPTISPASSVEQDVNGDWVLASGYTEGSVEFEFDLVSPQRIRKLVASHFYANLGGGAGGGPSGILDKDETDTLPETWTYEVNVDPDGSGYLGYQDVNLFNDLNLYPVQKMKIRVTLRNDA